MLTIVVELLHNLKLLCDLCEPAASHAILSMCLVFQRKKYRVTLNRVFACQGVIYTPVVFEMRVLV